MNTDAATDTTGDVARLNIADAAQRLGTTEAAVRMRIRRGKLDHEKDADGRLYVLLPAEQSTQHDATSDTTTTQQPTYQRSPADQELIDALQARIESQERQIEAERAAHRETRVTLLQIAQRVPELESSLQRSDSAADEQRDDVQPIERPSGLKSRLRLLITRHP